MKLKLLEIGKTRTKNASPDIFNFYVVVAGSDTAGLPRVGENSKPHVYKKVKKQKDLPTTRVLTGKKFEDFRRKKRTERLFSILQEKAEEHHNPKAIN